MAPRRQLSLTLALAALVTLPAAAQGGDSWQPAAHMPTPRRLLAAAGEGGMVYTFGGCGSPCFSPPSHTSTLEETRVEVFDPAARTWQRRGDLPAVVFGAAAAAPGDGRVYIAGGYLTGSLLLAYDPEEDAWQERARLPTPRHGLALVALDGRLYAIGGSNGTAPSAAVERYDPLADRWTSLAPLPAPRVFLAAAAAGGRIYAFGGSPDCCGGAATAAVDVYDPAIGTWSSAAPLPVAMQVSAAASLGGKVYVFGGFVPGAGVQARTWEYDPATGAWRERARLPTPRDQVPAAVAADRAWLPGGSVDCHCRALGVVEVYDPPPERPPRAELSVTKDDGVPEVAAGDRVSYTITVRNAGPDAVAGARVRDLFPAGRLGGLEWRCTAADGTACGSARGDIDERVDVPAGGAVVFEATATVLPVTACPAAPGFTNTATVAAPEGVRETNQDDNAARDTNQLRLTVDLGVAVEPVPDDAAVTELVTFVVTVRNRGPDAACGAALHLALAPALIPAGATCAAFGGASCGAVDAPAAALSAAAATAVSVSRLDLPPPSAGDPRVEVRVTARVAPQVTCDPASATLVATVTPRSGVTERDGADNRAAATAPLRFGEPETSLTLVKTDHAETAAEGDEVVYELTLVNQGPEALCDAVLRDPLPAELFAAAWRCGEASTGSCAPEGGGDPAAEVPLAPDEAVDAVVSLRPNERVEVELRGTVACGDSLELRNTATVSSSPPDGRVLLESTDVDALSCDASLADLSIGKASTGIGLPAGGGVGFVLTATNLGPAAVSGARVLDPVAPGLEDVEWSCNPAGRCDPAAGSGAVDALVDLGAGEAVTFTVTATVAAMPPCVVVNRAEIRPPQGVEDPFGGNDFARVTLFSDDEGCGPVPPFNVPALSARSLAVLALLLAAAGALLLRRRAAAHRPYS